MSSFISRYQTGETITVYTDIEALGSKAFSPAHYTDVQEVLQETFRRVAYNLDIIYKELVKIGYNFREEPVYSFEHPLLEPLDNTEELLQQLDARVETFGHVPLSLKMFYRIVGSCNFTWDYETIPEIPWEGADPIEVTALDDLMTQVTEDAYDDESWEGLWIAADNLHKDNISGGQPYTLELTPEPSVDSQLLYEWHDTTFINYLRIAFEYAGFPGAAEMEEEEELQDFIKKVRPQLLPI
jgi:hypothetical protein